MFEATSAPHPTLIMASDTGRGVEHRAQAVSPDSQGIAWSPLVQEQYLTCLYRAFTHRLWMRVRPGQRSQPNRRQGKKCNHIVPDGIGPFHGSHERHLYI